jgi:hypothetical protein
MPKELRISATISLPDEVMAQHDVLAEARPLIKAFEVDLRDAVKRQVDVEVKIVTSKARGAKAEAEPSKAGEAGSLDAQAIVLEPDAKHWKHKA